MKKFYKCSQCDAEYEITPKIMVCPDCAKMQKTDEPLRGILEVNYSFADQGAKQLELSALYPFDDKWLPKIPVGNTPIWQSQNLGDFANLYFKDDTHNLTGSFKDRASILVAAFARKFGIREIVLASTGNAASSMAGVGAAAGLGITIFLPKSAPKAKMVQSLQYGARVISVDSNYDKAFDLSLEYSEKHKLLSRNTAYNPMTIEGKKSASFEIFQQLGKVPDYVFVPTGDGVILSGLYKGFEDLLKFGFINKMPILIAVQAEGSPALFNALRQGKFQPVAAKTVADSIAVDIPRCGYLALKKLNRHQGRSILVSDEEILVAQQHLSSQTGLFAEPAASASYAGFLQMKHELPQEAIIVLLITGNGLKDIDSAMKKIIFPVKHIQTLREIP
ncbi:MAG: pyridoxal-phosphate dependent enzyme [Candidatus Marinimicrobia bacterium]|nr:pyridoxal-phosphate dependent enzyme [Candidatus Neomarinimicrobiota bacterium]